jgi:hypothetical protein
VARIVVPTANTVITSAWGKSVADVLNDPMIQRGKLIVTTSATGTATIAFPAPFQSAPIVVACMGDGFPGIVAIVNGTETTSQFGIVVYGTTHAALPNTPVYIAWIAAGVRA